MLARMCEQGTPRCKLTDRALDKLTTYGFPGNMRELYNVFLHAVAIYHNTTIDADQIVLGTTSTNLPKTQAQPGAVTLDAVTGLHKIVAKRPVAQHELEYITDLLKIQHGHRRNVAEILGMSEGTLYRKLKQYGWS